MTNETQAPDDWILIEAAKRSGYENTPTAEWLREQWTFLGSTFRALCAMIEKYEKPPVDRKLLCAQEALAGSHLRMGHWVRIRKGEADTDIELTTITRAIELYEEGFGK